MKTQTAATVVLAGVFLCPTSARADKIVLKNGRQIVAFHVVEDGDKIRYETTAGELSIPKSIVDHIERGGLLPVMESPATLAANLPVAPPQLEVTANAAQIEQAVVHNAGIDRDYLARLEAEARAGSAKAHEKAALAHHAAAQFELAQGDLEHALGDERSAERYLPGHPVLLMNIAYLYLKQSEFSQAVESLERAKRASPDSADIYKLEGWAYYGMNRPDRAVMEWQKAWALRPDADTQAALEKAQRDQAAEEGYRENESAHFQLKYDGAAAPELAREILRNLEGHFERISSALNYTPPEPIGVVLYTQKEFADITQAPGWVGALNDGRIRVPVQGLAGVNAELSRVLGHELTHSFIQQKTQGKAPTWIQEGVAQWMEGKRSDENAAVLLQVYEAGQAAPLERLEGSWMGLPGDMAHYAYAWALANIEYIVESGGVGDVERVLDQLAAGSTTENALRSVLHDDYADLMRATAEYLKKEYAH